MFFASDNAAPAHPKVIEALSTANEGYAPSYGADAQMDEVRARIRDIFEAPDAAVYLVSTGTTANVLALASMVEPWSTIYAHQESHINLDECGAPEFYTGGAKLTLLDGADAKISPATLDTAIAATAQGFVHSVQRGAVSITNVTECGAVYSSAEVAALHAVCKKYGLPLHMDGARFANAVAASNESPADLTWRAGVEALSFGGTKNGLMGVEAVILFNPELAWEFELRRKRGGHLASKHRYLSAQMQAYLADDLWLDLARKANGAAAKLADGILKVPGASLRHPRQANAVFATFPRGLHKRAQAAGANYYPWPHGESFDGPDDEMVSARFMCSWCTSDAEIAAFLDILNAG